MSAIELDEMFTASEISVQGSVAAGFEKVKNNLNLHQTIALQGIIHVYNVSSFILIFYIRHFQTSQSKTRIS